MLQVSICIIVIVILYIGHVADSFRLTSTSSSSSLTSSSSSLTSSSTHSRELQSLSTSFYHHHHDDDVKYKRNSNVLGMTATSDSMSGESIHTFADKFTSAWKKALCKGDSDSLYNLIPSSSTIAWDNPYVSNSNELKEGLKQFSKFFGDQEPSLTVFDAVPVDSNKIRVNYQLSFWYPIFWKPRIIIPIETYVTTSSDFKYIASVKEKWEFSVFDIVTKQFIPRLWDIWHIIQTPVPEYPPIRTLSSEGKVSFVEMPQTVCIETKCVGLNKYPGPPLSIVPGFSLFGALRTSRPNRDPIYPVMPVEVQSTSFVCPKTLEPMKQSSWIFHVPTSLQDKILDKVKSGACYSIDDNEILAEEQDDAVDEVDYEITIQDKGLMKSVTAGILRGNFSYDETKMSDYETNLKKDYTYKLLPKRILAQTNVYGEIDLKKINDAVSLIKKAVASQGKALLGSDVRIVNRDTDLEFKIASNSISAPSIDECIPKIGLQLWDCKGCFNPKGEPAMAVYEIQYDYKLTKIFVELKTK